MSLGLINKNWKRNAVFLFAINCYIYISISLTKAYNIECMKYEMSYLLKK